VHHEKLNFTQTTWPIIVRRKHTGVVVMSSAGVEVLVADSGAFIKAAPLEK
jgi:hypothetical protein